MPIAGHSTRYGAAHRAARQRFLAAHQPGDPCALCGQPMTDPPWTLDLAHTPTGSGYAGLAHRRCNRGWGQEYTNRGRSADPQPTPRTRW